MNVVDCSPHEIPESLLTHLNIAKSEIVNCKSSGLDTSHIWIVVTEEQVFFLNAARCLALRYKTDLILYIDFVSDQRVTDMRNVLSYVFGTSNVFHGGKRPCITKDPGGRNIMNFITEEFGEEININAPGNITFDTTTGKVVGMEAPLAPNYYGPIMEKLGLSPNKTFTQLNMGLIKGTGVSDAAYFTTNRVVGYSFKDKLYLFVYTHSQSEVEWINETLKDWYGIGNPPIVQAKLEFFGEKSEIVLVDNWGVKQLFVDGKYTLVGPHGFEECSNGLNSAFALRKMVPRERDRAEEIRLKKKELFKKFPQFLNVEKEGGSIVVKGSQFSISHPELDEPILIEVGDTT
jgi:hypothetical protein